LLDKILYEQIQYYHPDVILNQAVGIINDKVFSDLPKNTQLLVGQVASPLGDIKSYKKCDLMIRPLSNLVDYFRAQGVKAELNYFAFEPKILEAVSNNSKNIPLSFVGMLSKDYRQRIALLEELYGLFPIQIPGYGY